MLFVAALTLVVASCSKNDSIVYENIPATLYVANAGVVQVDDLGANYTLRVVKGGNADYTVKFTLGVDTRPIVSYNIENNLNLVPLPEGCYTLSAEAATLAVEQDMISFDISFNAEQIASLEAGSYALCLAIESDNANINNDKRYLMLCIEK